MTNSSTPSTLFSRGSHFGIDAAQVLNDAVAIAVASGAGEPAATVLLPELLRLLDRPHAGIDDRVEVVALLDRRRTLARVVEFGLEYGRRLQRLQERDDVADFLIVEQAMVPQGGITVSGL